MCNEYRLPTDLSRIFDRFTEIKVPFRWAEEPPADLKRHVFPKYQIVALRPMNPADPWAGFEGLTMTWGVPMMVFDPKKGKPVLRQPNNARDDKIEGRGWKDAYLNRRCLIPVREFMEWERPEGYKPGGPIKAIKHTVQLEAALAGEAEHLAFSRRSGRQPPQVTRPAGSRSPMSRGRRRPTCRSMIAWLGW